MTDSVHFHLPSLAAWPASLPVVAARFGLFLAIDARRLSDADLLAFARAVVKQGVAWACVWGPECERVHDRIDDAIVEACPDPAEDSVILTTWHADEMLEEALGFFVETLDPATAFRHSSSCRFAVSVGNEAYAEAIRDSL